MRARYVSSIIVSLAAASLAGAPAAAAPGLPVKTVAALEKAYVGETTAHAKYLIYAKQAEKEGYKPAASLFRAAALAEEEHARNHRAVLVKLGVRNPKAGAYTKAPGKTQQNLKDAARGEAYERDTMYPAMIRDAEAENQPEAVRSMSFALDAEKQHAQLYGETLKDLARKPAGVTYYVCPVCGATFKEKVPAACPTCGTASEKFKRIQ